MHPSRPTARLTILVDNEARSGLTAEHGFSVLVETGGDRILFDTGQGPALKANAAALGIDLGSIDLLVLSHGHYDHTGGVPHVIGSTSPTVCLHPAATQARYSIRGHTARSIGMPGAARSALEHLPQERVRWIHQPVELSASTGLTGPIPRLADFEDTGGPFYLDPEGAEPDPLADDLALWLRTDRGLVVLAGCSHSGLVNTLRCAALESSESRLRAVIGGFHLGEASQRRLDRTVEALAGLAPDIVVPCHCTGVAASERLRQSLGARVLAGGSGAVFEF